MAVRALLDVNVLIALAWPNHVHHHAARLWFQKWGAKNGWASCPVSEAGFVRVCCNPLAVRQTVTPRDAISLLRQLRQSGSHSFWPLEHSIVDIDPDIVDRLQGYRQITDALLLSVALRQGGCLATLDSRLAQLHPPDARNAVLLIPV
jgi:hypothetical protein